MYPRKDAYHAAVRVWNKLAPSTELVDTMLDAIAAQSSGREWKDPDFIPFLCNWLAGRRWEDEPWEDNLTDVLKSAPEEVPPMQPDMFANHEPPYQPKKDADEAFLMFWEQFPNKTGYGKAEAAWKKLKPSAALVVEILSAIAAQKRSQRWKDNIVPNPDLWLTEKRWHDELEPASGLTKQGAETHRNLSDWVGRVRRPDDDAVTVEAEEVRVIPVEAATAPETRTWSSSPMDQDSATARNLRAWLRPVEAPQPVLTKRRLWGETTPDEPVPAKAPAALVAHEPGWRGRYRASAAAYWARRHEQHDAAHVEPEEDDAPLQPARGARASRL
jgi:hypothetical protein